MIISYMKIRLDAHFRLLCGGIGIFLDRRWRRKTIGYSKLVQLPIETISLPLCLDPPLKIIHPFLNCQDTIGYQKAEETRFR